MAAIDIFPTREVTFSSGQAEGLEIGRSVSSSGSSYDRFVKPMLDTVVAFVLLLIVLPVLLVVAVLIRVRLGKGVLYVQERVGRGGKPFRMYKFRTMRVDAEKQGAVWATKNDPRITPIGRMLRKTRLDELPQLYNVLRGDMNIVGPRPERPTIFADLRENIPEYPQRQRVKPGITGWAQINQCYDVSMDCVREKVRYDLEYLRRQSIAEDLRIMTMTVPVMLFRKGGW